MIKFFQIKSKKKVDNFIGMVDFNKSIVKKKSDDQKRFSPFPNDFSLFYLSTLVGIKLDLKQKNENYELQEMTDEWTQDLDEYSNAKSYIIALYLNKLIKSYYNDENKIQEIMNKILDSKKRSSLSADGLKELHEYCYGGYEKILEGCKNETPSSIVIFLNTIRKILR